MTSAALSARTAFTVRSSGSPGPAPTRSTRPCKCGVAAAVSIASPISALALTSSPSSMASAAAPSNTASQNFRRLAPDGTLSATAPRNSAASLASASSRGCSSCSSHARKRWASTGAAPEVAIATVTSPRSTIAGSAKVQSSGRSGTLTETPRARAMAETRASSASSSVAEMTSGRPRNWSMPGRAGRSDTSPASARAASSATTSPAATPTDGARFNSRRVLTAASSPPPTTSGGLPSKLTKMGKVRTALSSHYQPLLRRVGEALGRKLDLETVERLGHDDLAAKPRALVDIERTVEHFELLIARRHQFRQPLLGNPDVAGRAGARSAALGFDGQAPVADHLHDAPAVEGLEPMGGAVRHMYGEEHT